MLRHPTQLRAHEAHKSISLMSMLQGDPVWYANCMMHRYEVFANFCFVAARDVAALRLVFAAAVADTLSKVAGAD